MNTEASVKFSQAFHRYILIVHQNYFSFVKGGFLPLEKILHKIRKQLLLTTTEIYCKNILVGKTCSQGIAKTPQDVHIHKEM